MLISSCTRTCWTFSSWPNWGKSCWSSLPVPTPFCSLRLSCPLQYPVIEPLRTIFPQVSKCFQPALRSSMQWSKLLMQVTWCPPVQARNWTSSSWRGTKQFVPNNPAYLQWCWVCFRLRIKKIITWQVLNNVVNVHFLHSETQSGKDFGLLVKNFTFGKFLPCDLVMHSFQLYWIDLFVLTTAPHCCHTDQVKILNLLFVLSFVQETIHDLDCPEEGVLMHLVRWQNFNHPINHLWPQMRSDIMLLEEVLTVGGLIA